MNIAWNNLWSIDEASMTAAIAQIRSTSQAKSVAQIEGPSVAGGVMTIPVRGVLTKNRTIFQSVLGGISTREIMEAVQVAANDRAVKAIVLDVESPGGNTEGLGEAADAIFQARRQKPVLALVDGFAASAAYYLASQANAIFVRHSQDMVGSIGTRLLLLDASKMFEDAGLEVVVIDTGEFKSAGALGTKITDSQREYFREIVNAHFSDFVMAVQRGRNMSREDVLKAADGRMFLAERARGLGLIDGVASPRQFASVVRRVVDTSAKAEILRKRLQVGDADLI